MKNTDVSKIIKVLVQLNLESVSNLWDASSVM